MKKILWSEYIILIIIVTSCKSVSDDTQGKVYGHITEKGVIDCFEKGLTNSKGELLFCETSAVVFDGKNLIFANDHNINPHSAVFSVAYQNGKFSHSGFHYFNIPEIMHAIKYEGLTETPDGKYIIATTGFDRIKEHSSEWGKEKNSQKMRASRLFLLNLALYARRDSNPQPLAPEANDVLFISYCFYST